MIDHSKDQLESFNPKAPDYRRKLWVRVVTPDNVWVHVYWGRVACVVALLALTGWLASAAGVWAFVRFQRGYTAVSYLDLLFYPLRREHYRTGLGHHYIKTGRAALEGQDYRKAYSLLQAGLIRVPDDVEGRQLLAYMQVRLGRTDLALSTLSDGAELKGADLGYLKLLFTLMLEKQEDERLLALAGKLLPAAPDAVLTHQFIALQAATAHFERGRYDAAERLVADWGLKKSLEGSILLARCDWERGYPDLAMVRLEGEIARFPKREELYIALIRYHRELGHAAEARRYALLRHFNDPASPAARIDVLRTYRDTNDTLAEHRELTTFFADFSGDPRALLALAGFAIDTGQPDLATQIISVARARNFPLAPLNVARVQALFAAQMYQPCYDESLTAVRDETGENAVFVPALTVFRCLALYGLRDKAGAELTLNAFLGHASLRASEALFLARQLRLRGATAPARAVLDRAVVVDPLNQAALTELVRLDAETGNLGKLAENLPKLLQMRKPSRAALEEVLLRLDRPAQAALRDQIRDALTRATATPAP
ncbi:MAG: hypothetical protein NTV51_14185 [Verrucomicrobia bacterium]|nr:hypothetical protein [Verrucomicrobiota bacterium]